MQESNEMVEVVVNGVSVPATKVTYVGGRVQWFRNDGQIIYSSRDGVRWIMYLLNETSTEHELTADGCRVITRTRSTIVDQSHPNRGVTSLNHVVDYLVDTIDEPRTRDLFVDPRKWAKKADPARRRNPMVTALEKMESDRRAGYSKSKK